MAETPPGQDKAKNKSLAEQEKFWHGHYCQWQQSGLSLAGYARSQGLVVNTFYGWHDRLKKRGLAKPEPAPTVFHRVTVKPIEPPPAIKTETAPFRFRLPNGIDCEVALDFNDVTSFLEKLSRLRQ